MYICTLAPIYVNLRILERLGRCGPAWGGLGRPGTENSPGPLSILRISRLSLFDTPRSRRIYIYTYIHIHIYIYTQNSPVALYLGSLRLKVSFESRCSLRGKARVEWNVYIVRRANSEYVWIFSVCPPTPRRVGEREVSRSEGSREGRGFHLRGTYADLRGHAYRTQTPVNSRRLGP